MQNFRKLAELKIPKNRGELYNNVNIAKSKNWKSVEIREIFRNSKKKNYGSREGYYEGVFQSHKYHSSTVVRIEFKFHAVVL